MDDGSTDDTVALVQSLKDARIQLIQFPENQGISAAINAGVSAAKGSYIARLDADDVAYVDRLALQRDFLYQHPEVILVGGRLKTLGLPGGDRFLPMPVGDRLSHLLLRGNILKSSAVMFRRAIISEKALKYSTEYPNAQDYEFWTRLSEWGEVANLPQVVGRYRIHTDQQTSANRMRQFRLGLRVQWKMLTSSKVGRYHWSERAIGWLYLGRHSAMYFVRTVEALAKGTAAKAQEGRLDG